MAYATTARNTSNSDPGQPSSSAAASPAAATGVGSASRSPAAGAAPLISVRVNVKQVKVGAMVAAIDDNAERPERVGVIMWMAASGGEPLGPIVEWPPRKGLSPVWNSARTIEQTRASPDGSAVRLRMELWGLMEDGSRALVAGPAEFPPTKVPMRPTGVALHRASASQAGKNIDPAPTGSIMLNALAPLPRAPSGIGQRKKVFFIRHGESKWNAAKRGHNVYKMVREHDHPLNEQGYCQALSLQQAIRSALGGSETSNGPSSLQQMAQAGALWASPLTRAMQTAIVALEPILTSTGGVLELKLNVREKKNFGGLDSIGRVCGNECYTRALAELRSLDASEGGPSEADMSRVSDLRVDPVEVMEEWWSEGAEDSKSLGERMHELIYQLEHASADVIIVVGHSHYFRALFSRFLHPAFFARDPGLAKTLQTKSVPNCTVLDCDIDFSLRPYPIRHVNMITVAEDSAKPSKTGNSGPAKAPPQAQPSAARPAGGNLTPMMKGGSARRPDSAIMPAASEVRRTDPSGMRKANEPRVSARQQAGGGVMGFLQGLQGPKSKMNTNKL